MPAIYRQSLILIMTTNWYSPFTLSEWFRRCFLFVNIVVLLFIFGVVVSEFKFDWCERLLGNYLQANNSCRPEKGRVWEIDHHTIEALNDLNAMGDEMEDRRQAMRDAGSLSEFSLQLRPGKWVSLERDVFKGIYQSLPMFAAGQIIDPAKLLWLLKTSEVDRIVCEGDQTSIFLYFINLQNRVLHTIKLDRDKLKMLDREPGEAGKTLEDFNEFSGRIYSAQQFFDAAFQLPQTMIQDLIPFPTILLEQQGELYRVGIWNQAQGGSISLGFEFRNKDESRVVILLAREWAVWQLELLLKRVNE